MPTSWRTAEVQCPFYKHDQNAKIKCEGVVPRTSAMMCFWSVGEKDQYMDRYCIGHYQACELYRTIMKKYEE